jgi:tetratricopeptide (TPR) repeat protein
VTIAVVPITRTVIYLEGDAMPANAVACPNCHAALRSSRPVAAGRMVRCPECNTPFTITTTLVTDSPAAAPPLPPQPETSLSSADPQPYQAPGMSIASPIFLAAVTGAILVGSSIIAGAIFLARAERTPPAAAPVVDDRASREKDEEARLLAQRKQFEDERDRLEREQRKLEAQVEAGKLIRDGEAALARKDYAAAETAFSKALKLTPDDPLAIKGLIEVRSSTRGLADDTQRKEQLDKLLAEARKAVADKQLAAAVRAFEAGRLLAPTDEAIRKELTDVLKVIDTDAAEKKKLAEYQARMTAGKAHFDAGRYADAIREFLAAQQVMPNDAQAVQGLRAAEAQLAKLKDRDKREVAFKDLIDRSKQALTARKFNDALAQAEAAARLIPDEPAGKQQVRACQDALSDAKNQLAPVMEQARAALLLKRFEEALKLFTDAVRIMPEDRDAQNGQTDAQRAVETLQLARAAYLRFMDQGTIAFNAQRYLDAATAFAEALRLVPDDLAAAKGLRDAKAAIDVLATGKVAYDRAMQRAAAALAARTFSAAISAYDAALTAVPDDPRARAGRREARYQMFMAAGQKAQSAGPLGRADAIKAYQSALEEKPNDPAAQTALFNLGTAPRPRNSPPR